MRLGILTQYYPPEMGAPQARLSDLAGRFARRGHQVFVLTAMPNYPRGRIYEGYGGFFRQEQRDGVTVLRSFVYPTKSVGMVRRMSSYLSFVVSSLLVGAVKLPRLDYLITESPPLFLGISGYLLSGLKRARFVFNVSDLWPDSGVQLGFLREGWALRMAYALEAFCYRKAWLVTVQTRGILEAIRSRFPSVQTYHLSNGVDTEVFLPAWRSEKGRRLLAGEASADGAGCIAIYAGLHGLAQGLDQILPAAARLQDLESLSIVFVGDGAQKEQLVRESHRLGLTNVRFLDPFPRGEIPELLASADVALVPLKIPLAEAVPSKVYEAMASGIPVLLIAGGEGAMIVREAGAGVVVAPGDLESLVSVLRDLAGDPNKRRRLGEAGRRAAERRFDRRQITQAFVERLEAELPSGSAGTA